MPLVTAHTEASLAQYMRKKLQTTADELSTPTVAWTAPDPDAQPYDDPVQATLRAYGVTDIADATDVQRLELLAQREIWRSVMAATVAYADATSANGEALKFAQIHAQAVRMFTLAKTEAAEYASPPSGVESVSTGGTVAVANEWVW
jgi:hypothetical protein